MGKRDRRRRSNPAGPSNGKVLCEIKKVKRILLGNGNPERGLLVRFDRVEQFVADNEKLNVRFDRVEQFVGWRRKVEWLLLAGMLSLVAKSAYDAFSARPELQPPAAQVSAMETPADDASPVVCNSR